jgi:hypothetical protein
MTDVAPLVPVIPQVEWVRHTAALHCGFCVPRRIIPPGELHIVFGRARVFRRCAECAQAWGFQPPAPIAPPPVPEVPPEAPLEDWRAALARLAARLGFSPPADHKARAAGTRDEEWY